jgi:hypothetical protein
MEKQDDYSPNQKNSEKTGKKQEKTDKEKTTKEVILGNQKKEKEENQNGD